MSICNCRLDGHSQAIDDRQSADTKECLNWLETSH
jgi:hypothetical protein